MKKLLLIAALFFLSTSFKNPEPELRWLATMTLFVDEDGSMVIYYEGNIPQCMSKKIVDFVYEDCDTVKYSVGDVERLIKVRFEVIADTCDNGKEPIKTKEM